MDKIIFKNQKVNVIKNIRHMNLSKVLDTNVPFSGQFAPIGKVNKDPEYWCINWFDKDGDFVDSFTYGIEANYLNDVEFLQNATDEKVKPEIIIKLDGGIVQSVISNIEEMKVNIIDFDTQDADLSEISEIQWPNEKPKEAYIYSGNVDEYNPELIEHLKPQLK